MHTHTHIHSDTQAHVHSLHTHTHARMHAHTRARTLTRAHAHTHSDISSLQKNNTGSLPNDVHIVSRATSVTRACSVAKNCSLPPYSRPRHSEWRFSCPDVLPVFSDVSAICILHDYCLFVSLISDVAVPYIPVADMIIIVVRLQESACESCMLPPIPMFLR